MPTAAYLRVSSQLQSDANGSAMQRAAIQQWIDRHAPGEAVEFFEDAAVSGKDMDRPEWSRMMAQVRAGRIKTVLAYDLSRCGRNVAGVTYWVREMVKLGVRAVFIRQDIDMTTANGRLMLHLIAAVDEWMREDNAEKVRGGVRASIRRRGGRWGAVLAGDGAVAKKGPRAGQPLCPVTPGVHAEIRRARRAREPYRAIARRLGLNVRTVRLWAGRNPERMAVPAPGGQ